MFCYPVSGNPS